MKTVLLLLLVGVVWAAEPRRDYFVYIGTFTAPPTPPEPPSPSLSKGVYAWRLRAGTGELTPLGLVAETFSPSFLAVHPSQRFLYAVVNQKSGGVSAFAIDARAGGLRFLNKAPSRGDNPCYVEVDRKGKDVLVANFTSGSVAVLPIGKDGRLGVPSAFVQHTGSSVDRERQEGPHAHMLGASPDDRFAIAADLGLDKLLVYRFDAERGTLAASSPPFVKIAAGSGPRHFAFHPNGRFVYVVNEMASTVTAFAYHQGIFQELRTVSTLPKDFKGANTGAEIEVHPDGRYLYASNRGLDSIAVFAIDGGTGALTQVQQAPTGGQKPRAFGIDPEGTRLFAANQGSHTVVVFRIDETTGRLTPTGQKLDVQAPACVKFVAGK